MNNKITFLMPGRSPIAPIGGYKVVYQYANLLVTNGYHVNIVYPANNVYSDNSLKGRLISTIRYIKYKLLNVSGRRWFNLNPDVSEKIVWSLNWRYIPNSDYYIATEVHTSYYLKDYPVNLKRCFYLIQDFEGWLANDELVKKSYGLGLRNITISSWLSNIVKSTGNDSIIIKNGFDFDYFCLKNKIDERFPASIAMLYHLDERKGCQYGIKIILQLHELYPELKATLFGVPPRPKNLPNWISYFQNPDKETHNRIYNESAIFLAPSIQEGWGLTVGEAMICGNAVVCSEALGFKEMIIHNETGLICQSCNCEDFINKINYLICNNRERIKIATQGNSYIKNFTWPNSFKQFESLLKD